MFDDLYEGSKSSDSNDDEDSDSTDDSVSSDSDNDAPVADAPTSSNKNMKMTTSKPKKEALHWTIISPEKLEHKNCKNAKSTGKVPKKKKRDNIDEEKPICSICLSDLILENDSQAQGQEAEIAKLKHCSHLFHQECIEQAFKVKEQCPLCMTWYSASTGNQPENATMTVSLIAGKVPGHSDANGCHFITYTVPSGIQTDQHLRPGVPYSSTVRYAYIPNNREGSLVLKMLKVSREMIL
jgi:hypothetical protein